MWIKASEQLPINDREVLVHLVRHADQRQKYNLLAFYCEGKWQTMDRDDIEDNPEFFFVKYWQPLPQDPE